MSCNISLALFLNIQLSLTGTRTKPDFLNCLGVFITSYTIVTLIKSKAISGLSIAEREEEEGKEEKEEKEIAAETNLIKINFPQTCHSWNLLQEF